MKEIEKELDNCKYFSFDTETTSLIAHEAELVGFSLHFNHTTGFYMPIRHNEQTELDADETTKWLKASSRKEPRKNCGAKFKI